METETTHAEQRTDEQNVLQQEMPVGTQAMDVQVKPETAIPVSEPSSEEHTPVAEPPVTETAVPEMQAQQEDEAVTEKPIDAQPEETPEAVKEAPAKQTIGGWWERTSFKGKEFTSLNPDGSLMLKESGLSPARNMAQLSLENADAVVKALTDKFTDVEAKMHELNEEWEKIEDKSKLLSKTSRMWDYIQGAAAIGDYGPMYQKLQDWRGQLGQLEDDAHTAKESLVKQAEEIAASTDWKEGAQKLRELNDKWKSLGNIDKSRNDSLWERLEAARSTFNQRKREHSDEIEKEHLRNLDLKMELVDKAEALAASEEWKKTTEAFKDLMEQWKKTGRTVADKNESLWQRFISAKNVFYDRKRLHYEEIQQEQESNFAVKLALVEKAEALSDSTDWNNTTNLYATLMDEWKASGRVGTDRGEELWQRMSKAKDIFFNAKRQYFEVVRVNLDDNLAQKMALVKRAEQLRHSTQWREATDEFAELMEEWKRIGPVARERTEEIWQQFSASRRAFFDNKDADRDRRKGQMVRQQAARLQQTREFLKTLKEEMRDEEEKIEDFKQGLGNIGTGKKEEELRRHLEKLIAQGTPSLDRKKKKIEEVAAQLEQLEKEDRQKGRERRDSRNEVAPQQRASQQEPAKQDEASKDVSEAAPEAMIEEENTEAISIPDTDVGNAAPAGLQERTHEEIDSIPAKEAPTESDETPADKNTSEGEQVE